MLKDGQPCFIAFDSGNAAADVALQISYISVQHLSPLHQLKAILHGYIGKLYNSHLKLLCCFCVVISTL